MKVLALELTRIAFEMGSLRFLANMLVFGSFHGLMGLKNEANLKAILAETFQQKESRDARNQRKRF